MGPSIKVIDNEFDDLIVSQNERVGVHTVDSWIGRIVTDSQGSSKSRYFLCDVSDVVPRGPVIGVNNRIYKLNGLSYLF